MLSRNNPFVESCETDSCNARLKRIIDGSQIPQFYLNLEGFVEFWNNACERLTGLSEDNIIGRKDSGYAFYKKREKTLSECMLSDDAIDRVSEKYEKFNVYNNGDCVEAEKFFPDFGETGKYFRFIATKITNNHGQVEGVLETILDLTDEKNLQQEYEKTISQLNETISLKQLSLAIAAEKSDTDTGDHTVRVGSYSKALASLYGMDEKFSNMIGQAARLHDIGKIQVPKQILNKEGKLTSDEFEIIKGHSLSGSAMIVGNSSHDIMARRITLYHHERVDGKGYPDGLKDMEIPIEARIAAIADCYDALTTKRPYRDALTDEKALDIMQNETGHFDDSLLEKFVKHKHIFSDIRKNDKETGKYCNSLKTFVVEDDPYILESLEDYMTMRGDSEVRGAVDLNQAYKVLDGFTPDLAIIDINLPDGKGDQLVPYMKAKNPFTYLICSTGMGYTPELIDKFDRKFQKPYKLQRIGEMIDILKKVRLYSC
ncbi:MAG: HD domain-containing phosphohydrolase [Nanobdellota archaeon]